MTTKKVKKDKELVGVLNILGTDWKVKLRAFPVASDGTANEEAGYCCGESNEIHINSLKADSGYQDVLLHEVLHAIDKMGDLEFSEAQVRATATALRGFFRANPKVGAWLTA